MLFIAIFIIKIQRSIYGGIASKGMGVSLEMALLPKLSNEHFLASLAHMS